MGMVYSLVLSYFLDNTFGVGIAAGK